MDIFGDTFWEEALSDVDIKLSPKGLAAPASERIESPAEERVGTLLKMSFDIWFFDCENEDKHYMMESNQKLTDYGKMRLRQALVQIKRQGKRRG